MSRQYSAGPSASGSEAEGLTAAERRKRKAMEYEEDEAAEEQQVVELSEAQAQLPNLPLPVSSDGSVRADTCDCLDRLLTLMALSTGFFAYPASSNLNPTLSTRIPIKARASTRTAR